MASITGEHRPSKRHMNNNYAATVAPIDAYGNAGVGVISHGPALTTKIDKTSSPVYTYIGEAAPGSTGKEDKPLWRVGRMADDGSSVQWAKSTDRFGDDQYGMFACVWDDRETLEYS